MKNLYLNHRFFYLLFLNSLFYLSSFFWEGMMIFAHIFLVGILVLLLLDIFLFFLPKKNIQSQRILPEKLSNGDENEIQIFLQNHYFFKIKVKMIDEIPFQFQKRDFEMIHFIDSGKNLSLKYHLTPKQRGEYHFGHLNLFVSGFLGLISRRFVFSSGANLACYPSFVNLFRYELMAIHNEFSLFGNRKIRKIGSTMEFEQIKEYVQGDDVRTINWKASSKHNKLMVNQFQDEKSQQIYMLIDKGRTMQMPFGGMTLLDYAINSAMGLSHIIIKKGDKAGLMTFSTKIEDEVKASQKTGQMRLLSEALYHIQTLFKESDFEKLYFHLRQKVRQRSLILLYSNFESLDSLNRQLKYLRLMARHHLVVVIFFKNKEYQQLVERSSTSLIGVYDEIIAQKFEMEKKLIIQRLAQYGIHSLYTLPENLSISVINKYLEIKSRGLL